MDRKKELKEEYRQMRPDMGVFLIRSKINDKCYLEKNKDLKSIINRRIFDLKFGNHPNKELQKEWKEYGESNFTIEILEKLEYDEDETKTDYTEELNILEMMWEDKLAKEKIEFYKK